MGHLARDIIERWSRHVVNGQITGVVKRPPSPNNYLCICIRYTDPLHLIPVVNHRTFSH